MSGCTHEEADTRIFLHVDKIIIQIADTDVVVLAISVSVVEEIKV